VAYTKQTWANGPSGGTPISAARLQHIEDGIGNIDNRVTTSEAGQSSLPAVGSYSYDANGNVLADPDGNTYTWNTDGTVATQTRNGVTRTFHYDDAGNLVSVS
jgi:YD repeat-containing protein